MPTKSGFSPYERQRHTIRAVQNRIIHHSHANNDYHQANNPDKYRIIRIETQYLVQKTRLSHLVFHEQGLHYAAIEQTILSIIRIESAW